MERSFRNREAPQMNWLSVTMSTLLFSTNALANPPIQTDTEAEVRQADSAFWKAYNACDINAMAAFIADDIEFYHDKSGLTKTRPALVDSLRTGICADPARRIRREEVPGAVGYFPVAGERAILSGEHRFYITENSKPEYLDGQAKFLDLWERSGGSWKMTRVFSFAHGPAPYAPPQAIALAPSALTKFAGRYTSQQSGNIEVSVDGSHLKLSAKNVDLNIYPESPNKFFAKERDLRFEFARQSGSEKEGVTIWENGAVVDQAQRVVK
jgi:hypothetical protein